MAFTVARTASQTITEGGRIDFDNIINNIGGRYIPAEDHFVCDQNGYYMFYFSIVSEGTGSAEMSLIANGEVVVTAFASGVDGAHTGSNQAVVYCENGGFVYLQSMRLSNIAGQHRYANSFSGLFLASGAP